MSVRDADMKIILLGDQYSGKTSLLNRWADRRFTGPDKYAITIGASFSAKFVDIDGKRFTIGVWDTAGAERYRCITRAFYRASEAALVCYSVDNPASWRSVKHWINELRTAEPECKIYIVATKLDLIKGNNKNRVVDYHDTTDFAEEVNAQLFESSSKTGANIDDIFDVVIKDWHTKHLADLKANNKVQDFIVLEEPAPVKVFCCSIQ